MKYDVAPSHLLERREKWDVESPRGRCTWCIMWDRTHACIHTLLTFEICILLPLCLYFRWLTIYLHYSIFFRPRSCSFFSISLFTVMFLFATWFGATILWLLMHKLLLLFPLPVCWAGSLVNIGPITLEILDNSRKFFASALLRWNHNFTSVSQCTQPKDEGLFTLDRSPGTLFSPYLAQQ